MLFVSGSWSSLNALGKFVLEAYKKREHNLTQELRRCHRNDNNDFHFYYYFLNREKTKYVIRRHIYDNSDF